MTDINQWNVVLLLPPGMNFIPDMLTKMKLPTDCTHLRGSWSFRTTPVDYPHNLKEGASYFQAVEALGDVLIYFHHPIYSTAELNVGVADTTLPLSFHDRRGSTRRPIPTDVLERSLMELSRLIAAYQPRDWGLVACNMGTAIPTILT